MKILEKLIDEARKRNATVIFAEGDEERTLEAALRVQRESVARVVLVSDKAEKITSLAKAKGWKLDESSVLVPSEKALPGDTVESFVSSRAAKGVPENEARRLVLDPLYFSSLYLACGKAGACVAGARSDTADVLRAALTGVGTSPDVKLISSFFLMVPGEANPVLRSPVLYADCAVNPAPGALGLRDIAVETVKSFKKIFPDETARVAFLSFSTKGSADHVSLKKIKEAVEHTRDFFKGNDGIRIDGELQFDAAVMEKISQKKAPGSPVGGKANIFIFPDLNAGNICYKMTERLAGFKAIGPIIQGLKKPYSDLSRGCSAEDIYYVTAATLLRG